MRRRKVVHSFFHTMHTLCVIVCFLVAVQSFATSGEAPREIKKEAKKKSEGTAFQANKKDPIFITSNWMEADRKRNTITYRGQVVAIQADMTMRSETLTAYYNPDMKQLKEVVAEGKVHVAQGDRVATGSKAVFNGQAKTITLTGDPVVRQGNNEVSGPRIIFFIEEDRAVAEGGSQGRVRATIFPEDLERRDKGEESPGKER